MGAISFSYTTSARAETSARIVMGMARRMSVLENEFARGEQRPKHIFGDFAFLIAGRVVQQREKLRLFGRRGRAAETKHPGILNQFFGRWICFEKFRDATFLAGEFVIDRVAVGKMQRLHEAWLIGTFAFAGDVAAVAPERF